MNDISEYIEYKNKEGIIIRREWYKNKKLHRINGPAIEHFIGFKKWYKNGTLYKECGPEIIYNIYLKKWFVNKKMLNYKLSITPKNCVCSYCLENISSICSFESNENFFHEKCLCMILSFK
jgi:hypothetical protein